MDALEQLNLAAAITDTYTAVEAAIIRHIAEQLAANPDTLINSASEWRIQMLARMGRLTKETGKIIASKVGKVPDEVEAAINTAVSSVLKQHNLEITDKLSENIGKALESYNRQAVKDKYNQVNTVMQYKAKQCYVNGVNSVADRFTRIQQKALENSQEYLDVLNKNAMAVTLGESSRTQALRETITEMSEKGIPAFVDASGREWSPEAYVNMDIRNTVKNAALAAEFASLDELGQDVILVSSHAGARKKCYPYQGKFFSRSGKTGTIKDGNGKEYPYSPLSETSFGEPDGLFGINCGHRMRGVSDGLFIYREKQYDEKENSEEYEKVCKQRQMERNIRKDRRTRDALEAAGDTEGAKELRQKIAEENKQLKEYCHREGLTYRQDRTRTYGYSDESRKKKPVDLVESVDKSAESGIIGTEIYFRKSDSTNSEFRPISEKRFNALTIEARKNGAYIIKNDPQFNKRLRENNASAVTYGDTIIFGENVTLSDVLEETHHFMQNKIGLNSDKPDRLRIILNEIDAKQYLLDNAKKYHIPRNETELTRKQLLSYQKQAKEFSGG